MSGDATNPDPYDYSDPRVTQPRNRAGFVVPEEGFEPPCLAAAGFKPAASAIPPLRRRVKATRYVARTLRGLPFSPWAHPRRPAAQAFQQAVRVRSLRGARARQHRESNGVPADGASVSACSAHRNCARPGSAPRRDHWSWGQRREHHAMRPAARTGCACDQRCVTSIGAPGARRTPWNTCPSANEASQHSARVPSRTSSPIARHGTSSTRVGDAATSATRRRTSRISPQSAASATHTSPTVSTVLVDRGASHPDASAHTTKEMRIGGDDGNRTRVRGFADRSLNHSGTSPPFTFCWLPREDSNLGSRIQSPLSYR
jgi:hypothetical protein